MHVQHEQGITEGPSALVDAVEGTRPSQALVGRKHLSREALAALGATSTDDALAVLGAHANEEAVGTSALALLATVAERQGLLGHDGELLDNRKIA
jgi:hypothetical protein